MGRKGANRAQIVVIKARQSQAVSWALSNLADIDVFLNIYNVPAKIR